MNNTDDKKLWFKRRRYGWGWTPVTWKGWLTVIIFIFVLIAGAMALGDTPKNTFTTEVGIYIIVVSIAASALFRISMLHGPKPKWRWGRSEKDNETEDF